MYLLFTADSDGGKRRLRWLALVVVDEPVGGPSIGVQQCFHRFQTGRNRGHSVGSSTGGSAILAHRIPRMELLVQTSKWRPLNSRSFVCCPMRGHTPKMAYGIAACSCRPRQNHTYKMAYWMVLLLPECTGVMQGMTIGGRCSCG